MSFSSSTRPSASGARSSGKAPASGSNRLPTSRERRPALAALAVILILLGAAGSALIALRSGDRQDYIAVRAGESIGPGQKITEDLVARGDLAGKTDGLIPFSEWNKVKGKFATGWLYEGQYLSKASVTDEQIPAGGALVGVSLEAGRAPSSGTEGGDIVQVVQVPASNQAGGVPTVLVDAAEVISVSGAITDAKTKANTTLNVTILVPTAKSTAVAAAAAAKTLVLVKLPANTKPEVTQTAGAR
ncbi:hypothetical protein [Kribbella sp. NPDC023855]|uniref:hypothetical protein n=1 Tax=Kribbella sp. NPDC023855 TaxID=3154698 RepID=UPI0033E01281